MSRKEAVFLLFFVLLAPFGESSAYGEEPVSGLWQLRSSSGGSFLSLPPDSLASFPRHYRLRIEQDPRNYFVSYDHEDNTVSQSVSVSDIEIGPPKIEYLNDYLQEITSQKLAILFKGTSRLGLAGAKASGGRPTSLIHVEIPVQFPKAVGAVIGQGAKLDVAGSESITFGGSSTWLVNEPITERGRTSRFPQLEMRQDMVVKLSGTVGDKVKVDVDQNSNVLTDLENRVKIRYEGYEDDVVKSIDLGNTNLVLPGTQYVSYGGRHEGLFGIRAVSKIGDIDLTTIASKEEGKTERRTFVKKSKPVIDDLSYFKRTYYLLDDPQVYAAFFYNDSVGNFPNLTRDSNNLGRFPLNVSSLQLYTDDRILSTNRGSITGFAYIDPARTGSDSLQGDFDLRAVQDDYTIEYLDTEKRFPILALRTPIPEGNLLAVSYEDSVRGRVGSVTGNLRLKILKVPSSEITIVPTTGLYDKSNKWFSTIRLELRNFYSLDARRISTDGFKLSIRRKTAGGDDKDYEIINGVSVPYVQVLGLDRGGTYDSRWRDIPDGKIDPWYVDLERGLVLFPDLRPFAPDSFDIGLYDAALHPEDWWKRWPFFSQRPDTLMGDEANPLVYDKRSPIPGSDSKYYMEVEYISSQSTVDLGVTNIIKDSEVVKLGDRKLNRGTDYEIYYETGEIRLLADDAKSSSADVSVDYSYLPFGPQAQSTLMGFSASYKPGAGPSLATTWIYESKGASEERPKLGGEPSRTMVGSVTGSFRQNPEWMTRLVNALPLVRTTTQSSFSIASELAMSFPNPNTRNEVYIDDMEGNKEVVSASVSRYGWFHSSVPPRVPSNIEKVARLAWYNPPTAVKDRDLRPQLRPEEGDNPIAVLEFHLLPRLGGIDPQWAGVTQIISRGGEDLTKAQFLEVWVNDFSPLDRASLVGKKLHIDLGSVSEDAVWRPDSLPNAKLDTEEKRVPDGILDADEDTGLDGVFTKDEREIWKYGTADDPHGDDYPTGTIDYWKINGTEGNQRLDTEDLNLNGYLDTGENFFEFSIDLGDPEKYVKTDVYRDFHSQYPSVVGPENGWRLFQIPISPEAVDTTVGQPSWDLIKHMRVWLDGFNTDTRIQIASIEVVGNRWEKVPLTQAQSTRGTATRIGVLNNKENGNIYTPPFNPGEQSRIVKREQSLVLGFERLAPRDTVLIFKAFSSANRYTLYSSLKFYAKWYPPPVCADADSCDPNHVKFLMRVGAEDSYYEYVVPVTTGWQPYEVKIADLSRLKIGTIPGASLDTLYVEDGKTFRVRGNPSFTSVRMIQFGVAVDSSTALAQSGEVWIDELRLSEVKRETGTAGWVNAEARFADLLSLAATYRNEDQDFVSVGQSSPFGASSTRMSLSGSFNPHKFVSGLGVSLPVTFSRDKASSLPKFKTGSDVIFGAEDRKSELSENVSQRVGVSFSKNPSRSSIMKYTVDGITANFALSSRVAFGPTSRDSSASRSTQVAYIISPRGGKPLTIFSRTAKSGAKRELKLFLLPENVNLNVTSSESRRRLYDRFAYSPGSGLLLRNETVSRASAANLNTTFNPILNPFRTSYSFSSTRDLMLANRIGQLGNMNIGTEIRRSEMANISYSPKAYFFKIFSPTVSASGTYSESRGAELDPTGVPGRIRNIANGNSIGLRGMLPVKLLGRSLSSFGAKPDTAKGPPNPISLIFGTLAKFSDVSVSRTISKSTAFGRVSTAPDWKYHLGISKSIRSDPESKKRIPDESSTTTQTSAGTRGSLSRTASIDLKYDLRNTTREYNSSTTFSKSGTWPDVRVTMSSIEKRLGFGKILSSLSLESGYSKRNDSSGTKEYGVETESHTKNLSPLLSASGTFKSGMRASLSSSRSTSTTERFRGRYTLQTTNSSSYRVNVQHTIKSSKGMKIPGKKEFKLKSNVNTNVDINYTKSKTSYAAEGQDTNILDDRNTFSLNASAAYNFSANVTGNAQLTASQNANVKENRTWRTVGLLASAEIRF
ncbi:MAG: cell surface protein SprA [Candidatus Eisenbacteria bacterium]|nr:cell surface protein SprA [Candidatus Eisenbacteria bacterium]